MCYIIIKQSYVRFTTMNKYSSKGFTLIELIVSIIILGIIIITAAPSFINLNDDAADSTMLTTSASFEAGVDQTYALWLVKGSPAGTTGDSPVLTIYGSTTITVDGRYGYPVAHNTGNRTADNMSPNRCKTIFSLLVETSFIIEHQTASFEDSDIYVRRNNGTPDICLYYFTETLDSRPNNRREPNQGSGFTYNPTTGEVTNFSVE